MFNENQKLAVILNALLIDFKITLNLYGAIEIADSLFKI